MNITRFSIKRPIGICMIYILVCVLGLISFFRIGVELLPDVDSKFISVIVNYPGASTESVEQQVTKPIEDELSSISHFKQVRSATRPGRAEIFVELDSQADADMVAIEATKKVSRIRKNLPEDIDEPAVLKRSSEEYPIIQIAATSKDNLDDIFALADSSFKERLQQAAGVADVDVTGGRAKEVAIEVDKDKLNYYGLTLQDIITAVRKENVIVSSGSVYTDALEKPCVFRRSIRLRRRFSTCSLRVRAADTSSWGRWPTCRPRISVLWPIAVLTVTRRYHWRYTRPAAPISSTQQTACCSSWKHCARIILTTFLLLSMTSRISCAIP